MHTPEPWVVRYYSGDNGRPTVVAEVAGKTDDPVCTIAQLFTHHGAAETKANASLIAAAPNLLEACKKASEYIANIEHYQPHLAKILRKAITKAEGKAQ